MRGLYSQSLVNGISTTFNDESIDSHAYDDIGNVTKYIDESGNVVAAYEYDAFGRIISQTGPMAEVFRIRFSTKYCDSETGLYYYGYRFYSPALMRWLNRDPIEEPTASPRWRRRSSARRRSAGRSRSVCCGA